MPFESQYSTCY